jgi:predicted permease
MLGVRPFLGRVFPPEDANAGASEVIISHAMWRDQFGSDPSVIGRMIRLDYRWTYTIVGVMPEGFAYPAGASAWTPLAYAGTISSGERQLRYHGAIARLREGVTLEQTIGETSVIAAQLAAEYPASNAGWTMQLMPLDRSIVGDTRATLLVLLGLAGCVLLVACGNVATLAVARATARQHETAVRVALGAGTRRLLRQWAAEGLLLALLGGAGGLTMAYWSVRLLLIVAPSGIPRLDEVSFGMPIILFVLVLTGATAMIVGLAPALRLRYDAPLATMRSRAGGTAKAGGASREWLVGAQVALTMVLTVAAALLLRSFERLQSTDLGYRRHDILSAQMQVPIGRFSERRPWSQRVQYYEALLADLDAIPGVRSVAGTTNIPLTGEPGSGSMWRTDAPGARGTRPPSSATDQWRAAIQITSTGYFETMGVPILRGRAFEPSDRFTREQLVDPEVPRPPGVAVINEAMAARFWPNADPLGQTIFLFDDQTFAAYRTIVGIVRDVRTESVAAAAGPTVFLPFAQHPGRGLSLVLRTDVPPTQLVTSVTGRLHAFDPAISVSSVRPLDDVVGGVLLRPRFTMLLVGSFAALALVIAAVGIFGIVGFLVTRRTHEIGIRMALGARPNTVLWLVLRDGLLPVALGAVVGSMAAIAVAHGMQALLYGVAPLDPVSFLAAGGLLFVAALIATLVPAHRAAGLDPLRSLRTE